MELVTFSAIMNFVSETKRTVKIKNVQNTVLIISWTTASAIPIAMLNRVGLTTSTATKHIVLKTAEESESATRFVTKPAMFPSVLGTMATAMEREMILLVRLVIQLLIKVFHWEHAQWKVL